MRRAPEGISVKPMRWFLPVLAIVVLLLVAAAIGVAAAAPRKTPTPPAPPAPSEPVEHTTLQFESEPDSNAHEEDDASGESSPYWVKEHGRSGDLVRFGEDITVPAGRHVLGDVVAVGGNVNVFGDIGGDAVAVGGNVRMHPGGLVRGETISIGGKVINDTGHGMRGSSVSLPSVPAWLIDLNVANMIGQGIIVIQLLFTLLILALAAWALNALASERTERAIGYVRAKTGPAFLWGLGAVIGIVPSVVAVALLVAILCITLIGIPVAILLLAAYVVGLALLFLWGWLVGAAVVGRWVWHRLRPMEVADAPLLTALLYGIGAIFVPLVLGRMLHSLGFMAPIATGLGIALFALGCLVSLFFWLVGMGSLIATRGGMAPRLVPAVPVAGSMPPPPPAPPVPAAPPPATPPPATA